jgi:hypothetical protein
MFNWCGTKHTHFSGGPASCMQNGNGILTTEGQLSRAQMMDFCPKTFVFGQETKLLFIPKQLSANKKHLSAVCG